LDGFFKDLFGHSFNLLLIHEVPDGHEMHVGEVLEILKKDNDVL
jgi:hypothetical protein